MLGDRVGSWHCRADGLPDRHALRLEPFQAEDIDAQVVRRDPLAMEGVDTADLAEVVLGSVSVKLVFGQELPALEQFELALVDLDHECVLLIADGTVTHGELREVRFDLEANRAAMTTPPVRLKRAATHDALFL